MSRRITIATLVLVVAAVGVMASFRLGKRDFPVTTRSEAAYESYREGVHWIERDQPARAAEQFQAALAEDPDFAMAWYQLYRAQIGLNDREAAGQSIAKAMELGANASELERLEIEMGQALYDYDFERYTQFGSQLVAAYPDVPAALRYQARRALRERDYDLALRCLERTLEIDPERVESHQEIAQIRLRMGDYERAINSLERYVYYAPEHAKSYDRLGTALRLTGQYDDAQENYEIALEKDSSFLSSVQGLALTFLSTGQLQRARSLIQEFAPAFAERQEACSLDVMDWTIDFVHQDWDALIAGSDKYLPLPDALDEEHPDFPVIVHLLRSIAFAELNRPEESEQESEAMSVEIDRLFTRYPKTADSHDTVRLLKALVDLRLALARGDIEPAVDEMRAAIDESGLSPHHLAEHRTELARAYLRLGRAEDAMNEAKVVLERMPNFTDMLWIAAQASMALNDEAQAAVLLRHYLALMSKADDDHPDVVEALALARRISPSM